MIQTKRLILQPFIQEDERRILSIMTDGRVKATYLVPDFASEEQGLKTARHLIKLSHASEHFVFGIYREGELIGFLNDTEIEDGCIEMGYVIAPEYQKMGYATEAFGAMISYLFEKGFREVTAGAFDTNIASIRVMEKCGMSKISKRADIEYRGKLHHCIYYTIRN